MARRQVQMDQIRQLSVSVEVLIIVITNLLNSYFRFGQNWQAVLLEYPGQPKILIYPLIWIFAMYSVHAWDKSNFKFGTEFYSKVLIAAWRSLLLFGCFAFLVKFPISRLWVASNIISTVLLLVLFRLIIRHVFLSKQKDITAQRYLYVGTKKSLEENIQEFRSNFGFQPNIEIMLPPDSDDIQVWINQYESKISGFDFDGVIVGYAQISDANLLRTIADTNRECISDFILISRIAPLIPRMEVQETPTLVRIRESHVVGSGALVKRMFDFFFSAVMLILLSPLLLTIAVLVKITSPGPVLYIDLRIGQNGTVFKFPKFRSMYVGSHLKRLEILGRPDENMIHRYKKDPRITPFGRFIRRWSLDELPQLWSVFTGKMSIVGPRPILGEEGSQVKFEHRLRFIAKPGLTGLWQVTGRKEVPWDDRMLRDIAYIEQWTFAKDLILILRTIKAILSGEGAH